MVYLERTLDQQLDALLAVAPAVAVEGPKGVGKTDTAARRAETSWMLDDQDQRGLLAADASRLRRRSGTTLVDEWQRLPETWDVVRRMVDDGAEAGSFLLTGSATPTDGQGAHSGAGRILSLRMRPMALHERGTATPTVSLQGLLDGEAEPIEGETDWSAADYLAAVVESGFPGIRDRPALLREELLDSYLDRIIDRDLPDFGFTVRRPETLRRWLAAYAAASSTTTKYSELLDATTAGDGSQPSKSTTIAYRDHLTQLWLLDPVPGWSPTANPFGRLQQAPKHQLADPALAARLLHHDVDSLMSPHGASTAGRLVESLATLGVRVAAGAARARVGHLRTGNGDREVDLIVEGRGGRVVGIEVKLAASVTDRDLRHLHWLRERMGGQVADLVVLTTGRYAYRRQDGVAVVPLALLGA